MYILFQSLFQCDQVLYTIVPVSGQQDLERSYLENSEGVSLLMFNCESLESVAQQFCD